MKKYFKDHENLVVIIVFLVTMIVALSPIISRYCLKGHDSEYHLLRIEALKEQILMGKPFSKVNSFYFGGAGYASSMFYSDLLLYIPALLRVIGVTIKASYHSYIAICVILTFMSASFCVRKMTGSKYAGLLSGILITLCPYHMDDVFVRGAAGEYMAFIFLPIAIYAVYNILYENMDKPYLFVIGFTGLILSHPATTLMCVTVALGAFIIKFKSFISDKKLILRVVISAIITFGITAFYLIPMFEQFVSGTFKVSENWSDMQYAATSLVATLSDTFPCVGFMPVAILVLRVFVSKKDMKILAFSDILMAAGVIFTILSLDIIPWDRIGRFLSFVQFPWRFFIMSSTLFVMADAIIIYALIEIVTKKECEKNENSDESRKNEESDSSVAINDKESNIGKVIYMKRDLVAWEITFVLIIAIFSQMAMNRQMVNTMGYYDYSDDYYSYKPHTATVIGGEWLPTAVTDLDKLVEDSDIAVSSTEAELSVTRDSGDVIVDIPVHFDYVDVPLVYYKGYEAVLETSVDDSYRVVKCLVTGEGKNGLARVYIGENEKGILTVYYKGTTLMLISNIISLLSIAVAIVFIIRRKKKSKDSGNLNDRIIPLENDKNEG